MAPSSSATTPGSCFPSNNSKLAPPPVEMWLITSATPTFSTAATESPPPIIVVTPFLLSSANFFAIAYGRGITVKFLSVQICSIIELNDWITQGITSVPTANLSNSKTPIGPFQMIVCVVSRASLNVLTESGPMSSPIQPSGIADAGTVYRKIPCQVYSLHRDNYPQRLQENKNVIYLAVSIRSKLISNDNVRWQQKGDTLFLCFCKERCCQLKFIFLNQGRTN